MMMFYNDLCFRRSGLYEFQIVSLKNIINLFKKTGKSFRPLGHAFDEYITSSIWHELKRSHKI